MANLALAWVNLADLGTLTASAQLTLAPVSMLQNRHVGEKWRFNATSGYVVCDLGSTKSVDTIALMGMSGDDPALRVKVSTADSSGAAGDAYDSGALASAWDSDYLPFVRLISAPVSGRYVRIDISEVGVDYIEAGRLFIGVRQQFGINFRPGWERAIVDPSIRTGGLGGQTFDDLRDKYRTLALTIEWATLTERNNIIEAIDLALGQTGDMLVVTDPNSSTLSRDCIWGYQENLNPVIEPVIVADGPRFSRTFSIRERL